MMAKGLSPGRVCRGGNDSKNGSNEYQHGAPLQYCMYIPHSRVLLGWPNKGVPLADHSHWEADRVLILCTDYRQANCPVWYSVFVAVFVFFCSHAQTNHDSHLGTAGEIAARILEGCVTGVLCSATRAASPGCFWPAAAVLHVHY
jgi:hypothetical protein